MPAENPDTFNQRLSRWVASQGFWFQLRYSMASGGSKAVILAHLFRFLTRFLILAAVLAIGAGVYLWKLPGFKSFQEGIEKGINTALGAEETKMSGFKQVQGEMMIRRLVSEGGKDTFFSLLEARNVKGRMGFLDPLTRKWNLGAIAVSDLDLTINAGADDPAGANRIGQILFQSDSEKLPFETIDAIRCSIRWGFSERTMGRLVDSHVRFNRGPTGWRIQASGGEFSQGWLKGLEVIDLVADCRPDGITFEKAEFRKGTGSVSFAGLRVEAGSRPELKGRALVSQVPIDGLLQPEAREWIDGMATGEFKISGSTNTDEGLVLDGLVNLAENSPLIMMDRVYLLRAVSDFSVLYNFKTVMFTEGSFKMRTQGGGMQISELTMRGWGGGKGRQDRRPDPKIASGQSNRKLEDSLTLAGTLKVRLPTREEAEAAVERNRAGDPVSSSGPIAQDLTTKGSDEMEISLRKAAEAARKEREKASGKQTSGDSAAIFERAEQTFETRVLREQALARQSRRLVYEGGFLMGLPGEVFADNPTLREMFPPDASTGRITLQVPLGGDLYSLTYKQAEDLYIRGERYGGGRN